MRRWWTAWSLVGIGLVTALTVRSAVTLADPSDPTPVLRTFAVATGGLIGLAVAAGAVQTRRRSTRLVGALYLRLAVSPVSRRAVRAAVRRHHRKVNHLYQAWIAAVTALVLVAIGLGEDGPTRALMGAALVLVVALAAAVPMVLARVTSSTDDLVAPLGLRVTETPTFVRRPTGGQLQGTSTYRGERGGRAVTVTQSPSEAVTVVGGVPPSGASVTPTDMVSLTGLPAETWRGVGATVVGDRVEVRRRGSGAGRWLLEDLLLAEALAGSCPPGSTDRGR